MSQPLSLPSPLPPCSYYGLKLNQTSVKINVGSLFAFLCWKFFHFASLRFLLHLRGLRLDFLFKRRCFLLFPCLPEGCLKIPSSKDWDKNSYNSWISPFWLCPCFSFIMWDMQVKKSFDCCSIFPVGLRAWSDPQNVWTILNLPAF